MTTAALPPATPAEPAEPTTVHTGLHPESARRLAIAERVLYGAGGILAAVGPQTDVVPLHVAVVAAGAGSLAVLWRRTRSGGASLLLACTRALPLLGLSGTYAAALIAPGYSWWETAAPVALAAAAGLASPLTRSVGISRAIENLPAVVEAPAQHDPGDYLGGVRALWAAAAVTKGTDLSGLYQPNPDRPAFAAVLLAAPGEAVSSRLDRRAVAAVFDVPEAAVFLNPIAGSGPGRLALLVDPARAAEEAAREQDPVRVWWEQKVSGPGGAAPGMHLAAYRIEAEEGRAMFRVEAAEDQELSLPRRKLARALGVEDPDLLMIGAAGLSGAVVTIYRDHPLINVREATAEDLTMRADGTIALGLRHDGRPARMPLYDTDLGGLTDLFVGAPGSGKSVALLHVITAERLSGIVSIVADAQGGMSLPEAKGRVYAFGAGLAEFGATLAGACALADYREQISTANGWGSFALGDPWALVNISLDEINRVIANDAEAPEDFKKWVVAMITRAQLTFRKLGMGIRYAGQSVHLEDLGDAEKIRANAKQGSVWLGRVNSTMTKRLASDMTSGEVEITPIPRHFGGGGDAEVEAAWTGEEAPTGPVTAGVAWHICGGVPALMRVWRAVKEARTYPHLIRLMESAVMPVLTPEEDAAFRAGYAEALPLAVDLLAGGDGTGGADGHQEHGEPGAVAVRIPRPAVKARPANLEAQILGVLAEGVMRNRDIRAALGADTPGGPKAGSVDNALSALFDAGKVIKPGHGKWAPLGWTPED
ncbi:hypothetical protein AB0O22_12770 [Streptomyces sp. NPDC091204]|uniref:hypothetical protein n=1 Tax=Streptomyces sp. NPDC091204 TaxID=3155299 RepID=UPI0034162B43